MISRRVDRQHMLQIITSDLNPEEDLSSPYPSGSMATACMFVCRHDVRALEFMIILNFKSVCLAPLERIIEAPIC